MQKLKKEQGFLDIYFSVQLGVLIEAEEAFWGRKNLGFMSQFSGLHFWLVP